MLTLLSLCQLVVYCKCVLMLFRSVRMLQDGDPEAPFVYANAVGVLFLGFGFTFLYYLVRCLRGEVLVSL